MKHALAFLALVLAATTALAQVNLVRNPAFETDADANGEPDEWHASGDSRLVTQTLTIDRGRDAKPCARLASTKYTAGNPAAHAMLCQMGVPVERGKNYQVTFWARGEAIARDVVSVALSDTSVWANCGLEGALVPSPDWKEHQFIFRATRDCGEKSRFQIWFHSTGTLWIDDVEFKEAGRDLYHPGHVIPSEGIKNLVPNASFECGLDGWGSAEWDRTAHWGGSMNRLFGQIDPGEALHGGASLKIDLSPENQPVSYFDYYDLHRAPIRAPLAGNPGFVEVEPGRNYTLSVYMKAARADTPALLAVRQFEGRRFEKTALVSTKWERFVLQFKPAARWCYVLAGPDLRKTGENPDPPERATVWLDAVQLEQSEEPTAFAPRRPLEFGVWSEKPGNVSDWNESLEFTVRVHREPGATEPFQINAYFQDFFDADRVVDMVTWKPEVGKDREHTFVYPPRPDRRGFLRFRAGMRVGDRVEQRAMRVAVIPRNDKDDSRFGVNHAYPWPHLLDLCREAGLVWMRDWSCKWQEVEPEKGRFAFEEADHQIDRPLGHGLQVLAMLPFPSAHWSSSAPADYKLTGDYVNRREHVAYAPRDVTEFENYVGRTVSHYRDRVTWWQVFNEPVFTSYSLPRKFGYDAADYAHWTKAFARAVRQANPDAKVLAGIGYLNDGQILDDWEQFLEAGTLEVVDAVDIHHYPRLRPPEFIEELLEKFNALMDEHGGRKPIWLTEYGYYADDEPWSVPMPSSGFDTPLESEQLQAAYAVRWATILFAGGVDKIFYHAGTCDGLNRDSLQGIFYEYAGQPHKIYAAQAVMAHLLSPTCQFTKRLALGEGVRGYLFRDGPRSVAVVWATAGAKSGEVRLENDKLQLWDLMGRPQPSRRFTPDGTPVYLLSDDLSPEAFEAALSISE
ncbi:MAG: carbohydrate binding domain-containing protein [Planctomycetota bacterium]